MKWRLSRNRVLLGIVTLACGVPRAVAQSTSAAPVAAQSAAAQKVQPAPRIRFDTAAGAFIVETFPLDAPQTVAHIIRLVEEGFYDGQRVHRALSGFIVQFGDPRTRDESKRALWGRGPEASSGRPIGAAEIVDKQTHVAGAVGVAHMGMPANADSQIYITLAPRPDLDGQYAVFGRVVDGFDVPARLHVGDVITRATIQP